MSPIRRVFVLAAVFAVAGCAQLGYYGQAVRGQWQIVHNREPIDTLIASPDTPEKLRQRLERVQRIRNFAANELALPDNQTFRSFTELNRKYVVWNVIAAPEFDVQPKTWCFPVAGCVAYKGFFSRRDAEAFNQELIDQGYDTFSYGVGAYSTLGWFADPVLDTFIHYDETALAGLIFHELAHQVAYVRDDSAFNEAFATAVQFAGVKRWLAANGNSAQLAAYLERWERQNAITEMILEFRESLSGLYALPLDSASMKLRKSSHFERLHANYQRMQQNGLGTAYYDWWFSLDLNNAHLLAVATYHRLVPGFLAHLESSGSLAQFYRDVSEAAGLDPSARAAWLSQGDGL